MKKMLIGVWLMFGLGGIAQAGDDPAVALGKAKSWLCMGCHGVDGNSLAPNFPKLAGQLSSDLIKQINDFKTGLRKNDLMSSVVARVEAVDVPSLAAYYAAQKRTPDSINHPEWVARGQKLFLEGDPTNGVPACVTCHGQTGAGGTTLGAGGVTLHVPALSGQHATYVATQLRDFKSGKRSNDPDSIMRNNAAHLSDADIGTLAEYITGMQVQ